jgi:hypothetical protein
MARFAGVVAIGGNGPVVPGPYSGPQLRRRLQNSDPLPARLFSKAMPTAWSSSTCCGGIAGWTAVGWRKRLPHKLVACGSCRRTGAKARFFRNGSARLKPCPDTKLLEAGDRPIGGNRGQTGRSPDSPEIFRSFSALFFYHGRELTDDGNRSSVPRGWWRLMRS